MLEAVILNENEAIIFSDRRQLRLCVDNGNVRELVLYMMMPNDVNPDIKNPAAYAKAAVGMSEDTVEIDLNLEESA
jgi:hypothetical protein